MTGAPEAQLNHPGPLTSIYVTTDLHHMQSCLINILGSNLDEQGSLNAFIFRQDGFSHRLQVLVKTLCICLFP